MANKNTLTVGYKETKDVLMLIIGLGHAYEQMREDGKFTIADLVHLLPVMFLVGPAIEGFDNVQLELKMANKEEAADSAYRRIKEEQTKDSDTKTRLSDRDKVLEYCWDFFGIKSCDSNFETIIRG